MERVRDAIELYREVEGEPAAQLNPQLPLQSP